MKYQKSLLTTLLAGACATASASPMTDGFILLGSPTNQQTTWSVQDSIPNESFSGLAQNRANMVVVGKTISTNGNSQGVSLKSIDQGNTWTQTGIIPTSTKNLDAVTVYGTNAGESPTWLSVGNGSKGAELLQSKDGIHWQSAANTLPQELQSGNAHLHSIASNGSLIIAVGNNASTTPALIISKDGGHSWQTLSNNLPPAIQAPGIIDSIQWDPGTQEWVASGFNQWSLLNMKGFIITSHDGTSWTLANLPADNVLEVKNVAINGQEGVAATDSTAFLLRSSDGGKTWTQDMQHVLPQNIYELNQISWNGKSWLLTGIYKSPDYLDVEQPLILTSSDSLNWNRETLPGNIMTHFSDARPIPTVNASLWNGSKWIAVGMYQSPGAGCYSLEGIQWHGALDHIQVSNFNLFNVAPTSRPNTYNIDANIDYTDQDAVFSYGVFSGQCVVNNDGSISVRNLTFNTDLGTLLINANRKNDTDPNLAVGPTCLPDEKDGNCNNFQGSLSN